MNLDEGVSRILSYISTFIVCLLMCMGFLAPELLHAEIRPKCSCYQSRSSITYQEEIWPYTLDNWPANVIAKEWKKIDWWRGVPPYSPIRDENYLGSHLKAYHDHLDKHMEKRRLLLKKFFEFYGPPPNCGYSAYHKLSGSDTGRYPSDFTYMIKLSRELIEVGCQAGLLEREFLQKIKCSFHTSYGGVFLNNYKKDTAEIREKLASRLQDIKNTEIRVKDQFCKLHTFCMKKHSSLRTYYEHGLFELNHGNYLGAVEAIERLIALSKSSGYNDYLHADTYLNLGIACSNSLQYSKAIEALSEAIEKDPTLKDAYLERAIAYFETGNFDQAICDYVVADKENLLRKSKSKEKIDFGKGFMKGALQGLSEGVEQAPLSLWNSIEGMGHLLWAGIKDPIHVPEKMINATNNLIDYLSTQELQAIAQDVAPELHELVSRWHKFDQKTKGEKTGFLVGKYGVDILFCYGTTKGIQLFTELKKTNAMCNLKTLASSQQAKAALKESAQQAAVRRQEFFHSAYIQADKQGKHILGHRNYQELASPLHHPHPEKLLKDFAGKGSSPLPELAGLPGYKEVVDFGEIIGDCIDLETNIARPTTRGTIHYSKNGGAHIVPAPPKTN